MSVEDYLEQLKGIQNLKLKLHKLQLLLKVEKDEAKVAQIRVFERNLQEEIRVSEEKVDPQLQKEYQFSTEIVLPGDEGRLVSAFYDEHGRWYFGRLQGVNFEAQTVTVHYLGYEEVEEEKESYEVRVLRDGKAFIKEGVEVGFIEEKTGKVRRGTVNWREAGKTWQLTEAESREKVSVAEEFILEKSSPFVGATSAERAQKLIERFAVKPNDTRAERLFKKRKIKKIKYEEKKREVERFYAQKTQSWTSFQQKLKGNQRK